MIYGELDVYCPVCERDIPVPPGSYAVVALREHDFRVHEDKPRRNGGRWSDIMAADVSEWVR